MAVDIDALVKQVQDEFWREARTIADRSNSGWGLEDSLVGILCKASDGAVPTTRRELRSFFSAFLELDFIEFPLTFNGPGAGWWNSGRVALMALAANLLELLAWHRDPLIAQLLPRFFGDEYYDRMFNQRPTKEAEGAV